MGLTTKCWKIWAFENDVPKNSPRKLINEGRDCSQVGWVISFPIGSALFGTLKARTSLDNRFGSLQFSHPIQKSTSGGEELQNEE